MKTALILVGTELLNGAMVDTNSIYMANELNKYGIEIEYKMVVRDIESEIYRAIDFAKKNVDLVILSGGLGPTIDDITKDVIAKYLGKPLIVDENELNVLKEKFASRNIKFLKLNTKEVEKPLGAISFKNDVGMAPAIYIDGIAAFPGVPKELYNMFPKFLKYYAEIKKLNIDEIYIKDLITYGVAESVLDSKISPFFTYPNIHYEFLVKDYGILIRLQSNISNKNNVEKITKKIYNVFSDFIFGEDDERLENKVVELLFQKNMTISTAESCTGGLLSSTLINVPGISQFFKYGVVAYSNEAKVEKLGIDSKILEKYGAVSPETAREMLKNLTTDVAISTTGIAGPGGDTKTKEVGLTYIGIKVGNKIEIIKRNFKSDRERNRRHTVNTALFQLIKILNKDVW